MGELHPDILVIYAIFYENDVFKYKKIAFRTHTTGYENNYRNFSTSPYI